MIEPYVYQDGTVLGGEADRAATEATVDAALRPKRGRVNTLALHARRRREDPLWGERSPEMRRFLLDLDRREAR